MKLMSVRWATADDSLRGGARDRLLRWLSDQEPGAVKTAVMVLRMILVSSHRDQCSM